MTKVSVKDIPAAIADIAASDFHATNVLLKKKGVGIEYMPMPGLRINVVAKVFDGGVGFLSTFGFMVPDAKRDETLRAMNDINDAISNGCFAIDKEGEIYFYNFLPVRGKVDLALLRECLPIGVKRFLSRVDEFSAILDDSPEEVKDKTGDGKYVIRGDD